VELTNWAEVVIVDWEFELEIEDNTGFFITGKYTGSNEDGQQANQNK